MNKFVTKLSETDFVYDVEYKKSRQSSQKQLDLALCDFV